jgi:hypothetical protein
MNVAHWSFEPCMGIFGSETIVRWNVKMTPSSWPGALLLVTTVTACSLVSGVTDRKQPSDEIGSPDELRERIRRGVRAEVVFLTQVSAGDTELVPSLRVTNLDSLPISGDAPLITWWLRAYDQPDRSGTPIWAMEDHIRPGPEPLLVFDLPPGQTVIYTFFPRISPRDLLGSRQAVTAYFTARLELLSPKMVSDEIPAGEIALGPP